VRRAPQLNARSGGLVPRAVKVVRRVKERTAAVADRALAALTRDR